MSLSPWGHNAGTHYIKDIDESLCPQVCTHPYGTWGEGAPKARAPIPPRYALPLMFPKGWVTTQHLAREGG